MDLRKRIERLQSNLWKSTDTNYVVWLHEQFSNILAAPDDTQARLDAAEKMREQIERLYEFYFKAAGYDAPYAPYHRGVAVALKEVLDAYHQRFPKPDASEKELPHLKGYKAWSDPHTGETLYASDAGEATARCECGQIQCPDCHHHPHGAYGCGYGACECHHECPPAEPKASETPARKHRVSVELSCRFCSLDESGMTISAEHEPAKDDLPEVKCSRCGRVLDVRKILYQQTSPPAEPAPDRCDCGQPKYHDHHESCIKPAEPAPDVLREVAYDALRDYVLCCIDGSLTQDEEIRMGRGAVDAILAAARLGRKE